MKAILRSVQLTTTGREIVREREVEAEAISVGRASHNIIALPDLAIEQQHLSISQAPGGMLQVDAVGGLGFGHDGVSTKEARIDPAYGGELALGSYRLEIAEADGGEGIGDDTGAVLVTVRQVQENKGLARDRLAGFDISSVMPSRRVTSWAAVLLILAAFLAVPIYTHVSRDRVAQPDIGDEGATRMDASWSTGALSSVHHGLEDNCEACHVEPFVAVRDEACLSCHQDIGNHAQPRRLVAGMPAFTGGEAFLWSVAHAFNKPGPGACTDCHTEHEGAGRMEPTSQQFCADCHDTLDTRLTDTALGNASDFGHAHPQFQALVTPARGGEEVRLSLDDAPADFNGLKFPHDMHLSTTNGVARMAMRLGLNEGRSTLNCANCHRSTPDGVGYLPVNMEQSCETCHSLVYDRVGNVFRSLSHGNIEQTQADLAAADRAPRRPVSTGRRRPGPFAPGGIYYGNFSRVMPGRLTRAALDDGALCGECHYPADGSQLAVVPVTQRSRWFQHGWFDHAAHRQQECSDCHEAQGSGQSTDLLMPGLETCRDCHLGEAATQAEVPSSCAMCHSYHPPAGVDSAPRRIASLQRRREQAP